MESPILSSPESVSTASVANETSGEGRRGGLPPRGGGTAERRRHGKSPSAKSKLTDISALTSSVFGDSDEDNDNDADEESTKVPSEDDEEEEVVRRKPGAKGLGGGGKKRGRGVLMDDEVEEGEEEEEEEMNTDLLFSRTWKLSVSRSLVALKLSRSAILKSLNSSSQSKANNLSCTCTQSKLPYLASGEEGKSCVTSLTLISCNVKEKEKCAVALGSLNGSLICLSRGSGKFSKIIVNCLKHLESSFDPKPVKFSSHVLMKATGIWSGNNNNSPITLTWGSSYVIKKAGLDDVSVTVAKDFFDKFKKHVERPGRVVEAMEEWVEKEIGVNLKHFNLVKASSSHNLASSVGTCKIKKWADLVALLEGVEGAEDGGGDTTVGEGMKVTSVAEKVVRRDNDINNNNNKVVEDSDDESTEEETEDDKIEALGRENRNPISTPETKRRKADSITPPPSVGRNDEGGDVGTPDVMVI